MSHYGNLGTLAFRVVAVLIFGIGVTGLIYWLPTVSQMAASSPRYADASVRLVSSIDYSGGGVILFLLSKLLGRFVSKGLKAD